MQALMNLPMPQKFGDMDTLQDREPDSFALIYNYVKCSLAVMLTEFATWRADITLC